MNMTESLGEKKKLSRGLDADSRSQTDGQTCPPHKAILTS